MNKHNQTPLTDEKLTELMRDLPRHHASSDFLSRTVHASQNRGKNKIFPFVIFAATTAAVLLSLVLLFPKEPATVPIAEVTPTPTTQSVAYQAELAEIRRMNRELKRLQMLSGSQSKLIRVQNEAQQEYYIDVGSFADLTSKKAYAHFRPTRHF